MSKRFTLSSRYYPLRPQTFIKDNTTGVVLGIDGMFEDVHEHASYVQRILDVLNDAEEIFTIKT